MSGGILIEVIEQGGSVIVEEVVVKVVEVYDFTIAGDVIPGSLGTTKGDMIVYAASGDPRRLPAGSNGTFLKYDSSQSLGVTSGVPPASGLNTFTNNTASNLAKGASVVLDTSADKSFKSSTTENDKLILGVLAEAINSYASGLVATGGTLETGVLVQGNVARGDFLCQSTTANRLKSTGLQYWTPGAIAQSMTAYSGGGAGTVDALIVPIPYHPGIASQFFLSGAGGYPSGTSGCADPAKTEMSTNKQNIKTLDFDQTTQEYAEWLFAMPADYAGGTITAKFLWTANSTSTNSVVWGLQARCFADDEAIDQAWGTAQEVTDANKSTAYDLNITGDTSAITIGGTPAAGELVCWRAYRKAADGSDTLAADAKLIGIQVTYSRI